MSECKSSLNLFCYVCGHFLPKSSTKFGSLSDDFKLLYSKYFDGFEIDTDPWFVPKHVCRTCYTTLLDWKKSKGKIQMRFRVPMYWVMPRGGVHDESNCYACANHIGGQNKKKMKKHIYKSVESAQIPLEHIKDDETNTYVTYKTVTPDIISTSTLVTRQTATSVETENYSVYEPSTANWDKRPQPISEIEMDNIVASLGLSKLNSEKLARILKKKNVLAPDVRITKYRKRQEDYQNLYDINAEKTYAYCSDPHLLMLAMFVERAYDPEEWRLFIDSSKNSLKVVLLHVSNKVPAIPLAYSTETKETHEVLARIMDDINYHQHGWKICCDLKVVTMLCGLQSGRTKYMCFLCKWVSTWKKGDAADIKYKEQLPALRDPHNHEIGKFNAIADRIVPNTDKILLPLLHIKLGIVKSFIKRIYVEEKIAECLQKIFPGISDAKLKEGMHGFLCSVLCLFYFITFNFFLEIHSLLQLGVLNGPDIRKLISDKSFEKVLDKNIVAAWRAIKAVIKGVLGKKRAADYEARVKTMLHWFQIVGVRMSLKIHLLHAHLDKLKEQSPTESEEQGERYHQVALPFEKRYNSRNVRFLLRIFIKFMVLFHSLFHRYQGKKRPDAILGEICWWSQATFDEQKFNEEDEDTQQQDEGDEEDDDDSDDDDDDDDYENDLIYGFENSDASDYDGDDTDTESEVAAPQAKKKRV